MDRGPKRRMSRGASLFRRSCVGCHGIDAVSGGTLPDLRFTPLLASEEAFRGVVIDGTLEDRGMISFAEIMNASDAEDLRAYLVNRAHESMQ